ncbi:MAG TPA: N-6 DNA methylase [Chryseolinea sp.]
MLDTDTKRRIDTARDILVGKVPDPKSQVEQITIALIYKFMDDMDAESEELGGKRKFFTGDFARYGWAKLMRSGLGGHELLGLYAEGITKMPENPGIPLLFRDIFKNAYLPYRDPETLKAFLKVIDEFTYDHSERLGDAFEYLLSVLGSQGDAGQFRTPRHIIDFIVSVIDPKKNETVLDPACGTAGFLISSYKHILRANTNAKGHSTLTPDERGRLAKNFKGYDISPDMVRLSLVNLYLHGFTDPHIDEYDTLTSEERWNEFADVILANPPFMSPKGGIKPHKRFSIQAKRSEVLFVDYMAEHLTPTGRAGIIVPEGIIFQSQTAYRDLRKLLVENSLVAIVSLPAGCFNPYSGVKTSILILDKSLARQSDTIAFFKMENDGFGLGAQRRPIEKNDLPQVQAELAAYLQALRSKASIESILSIPSTTGLIVPKEKIAANGDYNLSGERYRDEAASNHSYTLVSLGEESLFRVESGGTPKSDVEEYWGGGIPWATLVDLPATDFISQITTTKRTISEKGLRESSAKMIPANSVVVSTRATIGRIAINRVPIATNQGFKNVVIEDSARAVPEYVALALTKLVATMEAWATGGTFAEISKSKFCELQIPLPPLEVQKEIVVEIERYQKVINGARAVLDHYRPHIPIHPDWPILRFEDAPFEIIDGDRGANYPKKEDFSPSGYCLFLNTKNVRADGFNFSEVEFVSKKKDQSLRKGKLQRGDVVLTTRGTIGNTGLYDESVEFDNIRINSGMLIFRPDSAKLSGSFLFHFFQSENFYSQRDAIVSGSAQPQLPIRSLNEATIPLPPLAMQQAIVAEIEAEQALVAANRELISRMEKKIQATLARVWGEEEHDSILPFKQPAESTLESLARVTEEPKYGI